MTLEEAEAYGALKQACEAARRDVIELNQRLAKLAVYGSILKSAVRKIKEVVEDEGVEVEMKLRVIGGIALRAATYDELVAAWKGPPEPPAPAPAPKGEPVEMVELPPDPPQRPQPDLERPTRPQPPLAAPPLAAPPLPVPPPNELVSKGGAVVEKKRKHRP